MPSTPLSVDRLETTAVRAYCALMLGVLSRALAAASRVDPEIRREVASLPEGFSFEMAVEPAGPGFRMRKHGEDTLELDNDAKGRPMLSIRFKHLRHAWLLVSFQEGTARAFANDRLVIDGDTSLAMTTTRLFDRLQALILPEIVARRVLKRMPTLSLPLKTRSALRIYSRVVLGLLERTPS